MRLATGQRQNIRLPTSHNQSNSGSARIPASAIIAQQILTFPDRHFNAVHADWEHHNTISKANFLQNAISETNIV